MRNLQVEVDRFGSGEELPAQCGTEKYDIVFTDYQNLVFESFQYHPVWFVRKSNLDNDLGNAIGEIERQMDYKGKMVTVSFRDKEHDYRTATFKLADVYYMECNGHTITFFLEDGKVTTTGNHSDQEKENAGQGFVRIHSKYLVNSRRISLLEKKNVVLEKGITLPLSRYRVKQVEIFMIRRKPFVHCGSFWIPVVDAVVNTRFIEMQESDIEFSCVIQNRVQLYLDEL